MSYDYVIVGSGIAGLYTALVASGRGRVLLVTKASLEDCNTSYAQGGVAAAIGPLDSPQLHFSDTVAAGAGLTDHCIARIVAEEGPDRIRDLIAWGVPFDAFDGHIALAREGAHSLPRVLHAGGDATGANIERTLSRRLSLTQVEVWEHKMAVDIELGAEGVCGIRLLDTCNGREIEVACHALVLATGGTGQLYRYNTNPEVATGDGVALAYRAGAEVGDLEFFQFHPTALCLPDTPSFLISEAVRGEGAILVTIDGHRFMPDYDPRAELASRDVVARSIVAEMRRTKSEHVYLDVTHLPARQVTTRFPNIYRFCLDYGLDITAEPIPVAPAAHYLMGGIRTGAWGETTIRGLYACGEVACTGLHGANRLASNSLLEGLVFGKRVVEHVRSRAGETASPCSAAIVGAVSPNLESDSILSEPPSLSLLQSLMWEDVGIIRDGQSLSRSLLTMADWSAMFPPPRERAEHELSNMLMVGQLMAAAALERRESRGAHHRSDFPAQDASFERHFVFRR
ncbi:MAG: L-aspartate oxidase [Chloroflexota bacterium]